ncbi:DoxX family membrane protein [Williamsia sp. 1135]|uniref:DoxX family protein n=1 Tax=Williamsia sp. 1135 TaxID=1889262 RepID=UPI000A11157F|nr:DoxX family membrane protein [Williamsia sp. 1135]ORM36459.1 hypothetical protein BFL43_07185 [Williamsia sp. 1135]
MTIKENVVALLTSKSPAAEATPRTLGRVILGAAMVFAGVGHLTFARQDFQAQVPDFVPLDPDVTVLASGVVEIALGSSLILLKSRRAAIGLVVAVFFVAVFPGNVAQWANHRDAFGLDTDQARATRLIFQPVLIAWALWSTGAWDALRGRR